MRSDHFRVLIAVCSLIPTTSVASLAGEPVRKVIPGASDAASLAVSVAEAPLVFTTQILPLTGEGQLAGADPVTQASRLIDILVASLGTGAENRLVKLNFVTSSDAGAEAALSVVLARFPPAERPAVTFVTGATPRADVLVALDAVAVDSELSEARLTRRASPELAPCAVNPGAAPLVRAAAGPFVFIAGQAEKGANIAEATRNTLQSLAGTLDHLGLSFQDVVQIKSFLSPLGELAAAREEITRVFAGPQVYVEWLAPGTIEIELVAVAPESATAAGDTVEFITPPGMQPSPVFSRVTRTAGRSLVFIGGLTGASSQSGTAEVTEIFGGLEQILKQTGSDLRHLAKATYYVSTDDASLKLNELRPRYYDPQRPPAASKASVTGTGRPGKTLTVDMIAVPAPRE